MKGYKRLGLKAIQNARPKNARSDKGSGKEERGRESDRSDFFQVGNDNLMNVSPAGISEKQLDRCRKWLGLRDG